jgi:hypothetical protein
MSVDASRDLPWLDEFPKNRADSPIYKPRILSYDEIDDYRDISGSFIFLI